MQAEFRAPRRRTRVYEEYEAPLPLSRSPQERKVYRAELINQHVLVCQPEDIQKIQNQGYFGKGVLSRASPDYSISDQWEQHGDLFLPVVSQSRYEELLRWAKVSLSAQGLDKETANQILLRLNQAVDLEDVRKEADQGEEEQKMGSVGGACGHTKRSRAGSGVEPEAKRSCRSDHQDPDSTLRSDHQDPDSSLRSDHQDPDSTLLSDHQDSDSSSEQDSNSTLDSSPDESSDLDSEPDRGVLVPGPGFVLVVSESQEGGGVRELRRSPLSLSEYLQLSLEEAFFLVYSLGCLSVYLHQEPLSVIQLWKKFCSLHSDFISSYAAYHHFRSRGWVPKGGGGAKYGVDLMLYRKGPPFYHASYSVVIERTDETFRGATLRPFSWRSLAALSRITANVSKELMLCYIIYPADLAEAELDSPVCMERLKVQEVIVSRWVSSRERAEQDDI